MYRYEYSTSLKRVKLIQDIKIVKTNDEGGFYKSCQRMVI